MDKEYLRKFAKEYKLKIRDTEFYADNIAEDNYTLEQINEAIDVYDCLLMWINSTISSNFQYDFGLEIDIDKLFY